MDKIKVFGIVDASKGIEGIYKSLQSIKDSALSKGENVENMRTVAFNINYDDTGRVIKIRKDGQNLYVVAVNRQVTPGLEDAKEIFKQLSKMIEENPTYKGLHASLELLMRWKYAEDIVRKRISKEN